MTNPKSIQKMLMLYITAIIKCVNKFINIFIIKELSAIIVSENVSLKEGLHKSIHKTRIPSNNFWRSYLSSIRELSSWSFAEGSSLKKPCS